LYILIAAVALPATLLKAADVIDNPWQIATDRSMKAGLGMRSGELEIEAKHACRSKPFFFFFNFFSPLFSLSFG
jgi:hypothetical protein